MNYTFSSPLSAYVAMGIPVFVTLLLWCSIWLRRASYYQRFTGWRLWWEMWGSTILLSVMLLGVFYWYLFWRPFYQLSIRPDNVWVMHYAFPARSVAVDTTRIQRIDNPIAQIPFIRFRPGRQSIEIVLDNGRVLRSAMLASEDAELIFRALQAHLGSP